MRRGLLITAGLLVLLSIVLAMSIAVDAAQNQLARRRMPLSRALLKAVSSGWYCERDQPDPIDLVEVKRLLQKGADPNFRDENGCTPLWNAASSNDSRVITELVKHGAQVNLGPGGSTPWDIAVMKRNPEVRKTLENYGAIGDEGSVEHAEFLHRWMRRATGDGVITADEAEQELRESVRYMFKTESRRAILSTIAEEARSLRDLERMRREESTSVDDYMIRRQRVLLRLLRSSLREN